MSLPDTELLPDDPERLPPARRRRARRLLTPLDADERAAFLDEVAHRTSPTFDFYLFSFVAGLVMGIGYLLNAPSLLLLGALVAPLMGPALGLSLGTVIGSLRFFLRSFFGLLLGGALAFWGGAMAGAITTIWQPTHLEHIFEFTRLSWSNFIVLATGIVLTALATMHSERPALVPSVAIAFELYLPLAAAGFGLSSRIPDLWPDGIVIFTVYLAWATLLGALTLALLGLHPVSFFGYTLSSAVVLLGVVLLLGLGSTGAVITAQIGVPSPTATLTATLTPLPPSSTVTPSPKPPTATLPPTETLPPSATFTPTVSPTPLPVFAYINASSGDPPGAVVRREPGGEYLQAYVNGTLVEVLPESTELNGYTWVKIRILNDNTQGWILRSLLLAATPSPNW